MAASLKELLASKKADMHALAASGAGAKSINENTNSNSTIVTGMQSSVSNVSQMPQQLSSIKGNVDPAQASTSLAVFEDNDFKPLKKIILSSGAKFFAKDGFFYPKTEEQVAMLNDYARRGYCTLVVTDDLFDSKAE